MSRSSSSGDWTTDDLEPSRDTAADSFLLLLKDYNQRPPTDHPTDPPTDPPSHLSLTHGQL